MGNATPARVFWAKAMLSQPEGTYEEISEGIKLSPAQLELLETGVLNHYSDEVVARILNEIPPTDTKTHALHRAMALMFWS